MGRIRRRGNRSCSNANPTGVPTRARTVGRGEDNDGLVVVATGTSANAFGAATRSRAAAAVVGAETSGGAARSRRRSRRTRPFRSTNRCRAPRSARVGERNRRETRRRRRRGRRASIRGGGGRRRGRRRVNPRERRVAGAALRWRLAFAEDDVPVAERFRRACEEVEAARAAKRGEEREEGEIRRANRMGCAERMIHVAMDDVSLVDRQR